MKREKGITLSTLIITIIVLLILSVVTIGARNNNIIDYAKKTEEGWNESIDSKKEEFEELKSIVEYDIH